MGYLIWGTRVSVETTVSVRIPEVWLLFYSLGAPYLEPPANNGGRRVSFLEKWAKRVSGHRPKTQKRSV